MFTDVFKIDPDYEENENKYKALCKEILGSDTEEEDEDEESGEDESDEADSNDESSEAKAGM